MTFDEGYAAAERDIVAWLRTQLPVPVCIELCNRIVEGAHREAAGQPRKLQPRFRWEIPIWIEGTAEAFDFVRAAVQELGAFFPLQLCARDGGALCVVPMGAIASMQAHAVSLALSQIPYVEHVGMPEAFPESDATLKGSID